MSTRRGKARRKKERREEAMRKHLSGGPLGGGKSSVEQLTLDVPPVQAVAAQAVKPARASSRTRASHTTGRKQAFRASKDGVRSLVDVLADIKSDFEKQARSGEDLLSLTRSATPIKRIHQWVGDSLIDAGVAARCVDVETQVLTPFGYKREDVVAIPGGYTNPTGVSTLSVGVKGGMYGLSKNVGNLFDSVRSELLNFHEVPGTQPEHEMVVGTVVLVSLMQLDNKACQAQKAPVYVKLSATTLMQVIQRSHLINGRKVGGGQGHAERTVLILADLSTDVPVVYTSIDKLVEDGFLPANTGLSMEGISPEGFAQDLLAEHQARFSAPHRL